MDFLAKPPQWLLDNVPADFRPMVESWGWWVILGVVGLLSLLILLFIARSFLSLFGGGGKRQPGSTLEEHLDQYPPLRSPSGDRRLLVENVPVRLRLLVIAPAGKADEIDEDNLAKTLELILPGLGKIYAADRPRVRVWPVQLSYDGFTKHLHRNTITPERPGELSPWIVVAGRAKFGGKQQIMLGMALQAAKPTTVGRLTLESHEWATRLRVKVRD